MKNPYKNKKKKGPFFIIGFFQSDDLFCFCSSRLRSSPRRKKNEHSLQEGGNPHEKNKGDGRTFLHKAL